MSVSRRVVFLLKAIPHYRLPFYEGLREQLSKSNVELLVIYGQVGTETAKKRDTVELPWGIRIQNRIFRLGSRELYWQPALQLLRGADLVVVMQEAKLLINYLLVLQNILGVRRVAYWGHGRAFQEHRVSRLGEWLKAALSRRVHWWFAYTERAKAIIASTGFPADRITVVQNSIDTHHLIEHAQSLPPDACAQLTEQLGLESQNVGIFIGGMYPEKRLDFLLEACRRIRAAITNFEMLFIGAGPSAGLVEEDARRHSWIHYLGPVFGIERVPYLMCARVMLNPGLVGLSVLDAFALEVPMVTTAIPFHSPEIDYLEDGVNGLILEKPDDVEGYAATVVEILRDSGLRERLREGCRRVRSNYTIEAMVSNFRAGLLEAMDSNHPHDTSQDD